MDRASEHSQGVSVANVILQCLLIMGAFYLWSSPVIQPVKIMVVLFHELSHGLMALATGGQVLSISITADEGGACETTGGIAVLIVSAGYLGGMLFGGLLLILSRYRGSISLSYTLLTLTLGFAVVTVLHDPYSRKFAMCLAGCFILPGYILPAVLGCLFLRVLGTVSCLYSIFDIYWDVLAGSRPGFAVENDAAAFASLTGVSAQIVGLLWLALSTVYFLVILKIIVQVEPSESQEEAVATGRVASAKA